METNVFLRRPAVSGDFLYENGNKLLTNWSMNYRLKEKESKTYRPKGGIPWDTN